MAAPEDNPFSDPAPAAPSTATAPTANAFAEPQAAPAQAQPTTGKKPWCDIANWTDKGMLNALRSINMLNGALVILSAILVFLTGIVQLSFTTATLSCYIIAFGLVMMVVECNISNLQSCVRAQCGFLFSFWGRATFIIFTATLCLALGNWVGYLFGGITFLNAVFNMYCICVHPAFTQGRIAASGDPYTSYVGGEKVMVQYLKQNPDLARRAGAGAVRLAAENPEVARQAAAGAMQAQAGQDKEANPWG